MRGLPVPAADRMPTPKLWLRLVVGLTLTLLGLSLLGTAWRTSALPLAFIALVLGVPSAVDAGTTAAVLIGRLTRREG